MGQRADVAAFHGVELLVHEAQVARIQRFEPDQHAPASRAREGGDKGFVMRGMNAQLRHPTQFQRLQRMQQFAACGQVAGEVVVHKKEEFFAAPQRVQLRQHGIYRPGAVRATEKSLHCAKLAGETAAAPGFNQADGQITLAGKHAVIHTNSAQVQALAVVAALQGAVAGVIHDLCPNGLGLAGDDRIAKAHGFFGHQGGMKAAQYHGHTALPVAAGNLVGAFGGVGFYRNGHHIGGRIVVDSLHAVIKKADMHVRRRQARQGGNGQRLHLPAANVRLAGAMPNGRVNQGQSHRFTRKRW